MVCSWRVSSSLDAPAGLGAPSIRPSQLDRDDSWANERRAMTTAPKLSGTRSEVVR
jgi:hypothetical protein